jgi:hypothetical protein
MTLRHKRPRPLDRPELKRDASLIVIATEDSYAPKQYFEESTIFRSSRFQIETLPTEDGQSSPEHVLERIKNYRDEKIRKNEYDDKDEFWLMLDTDHWIEPAHIPNFDKVCAEAIKQNFGLAHSNPSFEVWLLLHFEDLDDAVQFSNSPKVEKRLRELLGSYNKRNLDLSKYCRDNAEQAAERAKKLEHREILDSPPDDRWPQKTGSHVYRLVNRLLQL